MNVCQVKTLVDEKTALVEIPLELLEAIGAKCGQQMFAYAIENDGIWLSTEECPHANEFLALLTKLEQATKEAHEAVENALGGTSWQSR